MSKKRKNKKETRIDMTNLLINSSGKSGRHIAEVSTGCGAHKSAKDYKRKPKHKKSNHSEMGDFFSSRRTSIVC